MKVSVVERYRIKDVFRALEGGENVTVLHQGTVKGTIHPALKSQVSAADHPFFGSAKEQDVQDVLADLRVSRHSF